MPIDINEPLNTIQKLCQQFEYSEVIDKAVATKDPILRLCYVAGISLNVFLSSYSTHALIKFISLYSICCIR